MSSTINAVVGMVPPRRATGAVIAHPATTAASLPSSRMGARDRAQSWRGKYLRALNICPEDIELARRNAEKAANGKARVRAMSFHRSDYPDHLALSRSYSSSTEKEDEERKSLEKSTQMLQQQQHHHREHDQGHFAAHRTIPQEHHIRGVPLRAPSTNLHHHRSTSSAIPMVPSASNPYGFATRPNMARERRCHTDPFELQERVSAPIQIPSAMGSNNLLDGNERHDKYMSGGQRRRVSPQSPQGDFDGLSANNHTPNVRLLSWEEPVAMLAAADAVTKGWRMPDASAMSSMELGVRRGRRDEQVETNMDEDEEDDDHDAHGGDIFAMDESEDDAGDMSDNQLTSQTIPPMARSKSRRRYRTESMNIVTSGREKRTHHAYDDYEDQDQHHVVSQSFVPPHQMVDRSNLFSIGLRDELKKRRPANPI